MLVVELILVTLNNAVHGKSFFMEFMQEFKTVHIIFDNII